MCFYYQWAYADNCADVVDWFLISNVFNHVEILCKDERKPDICIVYVLIDNLLTTGQFTCHFHNIMSNLYSQYSFHIKQMLLHVLGQY